MDTEATAVKIPCLFGSATSFFSGGLIDLVPLRLACQLPLSTCRLEEVVCTCVCVHGPLTKVLLLSRISDWLSAALNLTT